MNNDLKWKLIKYNHKVIMAQRDVINKKANHEALAPLLQYAMINKNINEITKINRDFVMKIMLEHNDAQNVDDISRDSMLYRLDDLMNTIKQKI